MPECRAAQFHFFSTTTMFRTAATKIAHNSTLASLGGNQELRPLQDLITAEKGVLIALQKLSVDFSKASEALRTWGLSEGDDLGDILSASTTVLNHFSTALSQYAAHGHVMREHLKAIRTREESLGELKRRRHTVMRKAEDADKKVSRMGAEHKNLAMQTETLNRLREEIRMMDTDIMAEEAALGDFKRTATRMWMGLKFGGLLECCEKGTIAGEFGKLIIAEISEEITQPGLPRSMYYGHSKTESLSAEAHQRINEVQLSTIPSVGFRDHRQYNQHQQEPAPSGGDGYSTIPTPWSPPVEDKPQPPPPRLSDDYAFTRPFALDAPGSPSTSTGASLSTPPYQQPGTLSSFSQPQPLSPHARGGYPERQSLDDFGVSIRPAPLTLLDANPAGGRFATFPVKTRAPGSAGGFTPQDPPSLSSRHEIEPSFSASIAAALDDKGSLETAQATEGTHNTQPSSPWSGRVGAALPPTVDTSASWSNTGPSPTIFSETRSPTRGPLPPPPGAAPPELSNPWAGAKEEPNTFKNRTHARNLSDNDDALLAYMTAADEDSRLSEASSSPTANRTFLGPKGAAPPATEEEQHVSRHVRFGQVEDVDTEMEKRASEEENGKAPAAPEVAGEKEKTEIPPVSETDGSSTPSSDHNVARTGRVPPPIFNPEEEEKALNAAAAREITLELEAIKNNSPTTSHLPASPRPGPRSPTESTTDRGRPVNALNVPQGYTSNTGRDPSPHSPLSPPSAPFAKRSVSPHPYADLNSGPSASYAPPQYTPAQSYAQSYQTSGPYGSPPNTNISPAQAYAQSYQASQSHPQLPEPHSPTSNLPPRLQALNQSMENQVPPRFHGSRTSPPATATQAPPRFPPGNSSPIPPSMSLPEKDDLKYPRSLGITSAFSKSNTSLNSASGVTPTGARTISASAFRRPRGASTDNVASDPFKKSLPSSPYPTRDREPSGLSVASTAGPTGTGSGAVATNGYGSSLAAPAPVGGGAGVRPLSTAGEEEDEYDYIGAYVHSNPNSPMKAEFGPSADAPVGGPGRSGGGYAEGRFATDLEGNGLR
ncbi:unnamed protein product [Cyclocybe aegerita]|uniref:Eisosome component PIL1-domain-containing protein n=1 Tax=Cyclocybe aegerita TaxID=1973307 RepID=A0A8S0Y071_CYCAE|nr:unnamed protein product [Cyclocybe aegerita]